MRAASWCVGFVQSVLLPIAADALNLVALRQVAALRGMCRNSDILQHFAACRVRSKD